jgi:choline dehydrogenase
VRDRATLEIRPHATVEALEIHGGRVERLTYVRDGVAARVEAGVVVVCAGAYDSPALLQRSGVGDPDLLREAGIAPVHALRAVGASLGDHPSVALTFEASAALLRESAQAASAAWMPTWQTVAKERSSLCATAAPSSWSTCRA